MKRIIIHYPFKIDYNRLSASQIRPVKIYDSFKKMGYEIDMIEGYGRERKKLIKEISSKIKQGVKYNFLYSEASTMPTLLTEENHLPIYPLLDYNFFKLCKENGIRIGLFYRDIYWCFKDYRKSIKNIIAILFYKYDLKKYNELVDVIFVPSLKMLEYLPTKINIQSVELPSGCDIHSGHKVSNNKQIEVLYVGGLGSHYDLKLFIDTIKDFPNYHFTLCCRYEEWEQVKNEYESILSDNITIVHKSGNELNELYAKADLFNIFVSPSEYWKFAVPYKLFECIGWRCPIIASKDTWVGNFVMNNRIGFVCNYGISDLKGLLLNINHENISDMKLNMERISLENSWFSRCECIQTKLQNI